GLRRRPAVRVRVPLRCPAPVRWRTSSGRPRTLRRRACGVAVGEWPFVSPGLLDERALSRAKRSLTSLHGMATRADAMHVPDLHATFGGVTGRACPRLCRGNLHTATYSTGTRPVGKSRKLRNRGAPVSGPAMASGTLADPPPHPAPD